MKILVAVLTDMRDGRKESVELKLNMNDLTPSNLINELSVIKVIVFIESEPQSDHFHQIMLTKDQARAVRKALTPMFRTSKDEKGEETLMIPTHSSVHADLPDIKADYSPQEIAEEQKKSPEAKDTESDTGSSV